MKDELVLSVCTDICNEKMQTAINRRSNIEAIDLGLPSGRLWANMNLGANAPEETGLYYSWGNVEGHIAGGDYDFDEYENTEGSKLKSDIDLEHDAAHAALGGNWRMPTGKEYQELFNCTDNKRAAINGVKGWKFMKKSDHSVFVFFPAAGFYTGTKLRNHEPKNHFILNGSYWAADVLKPNFLYPNPANYFLFSSTEIYPQFCGTRKNGHTIRAIQ